MTTRRPIAWLVTLTMAVVLGACGGDSDDSAVERAEARVSAEEKDVSEAQAAAADAAEEFCEASKPYIVALDRYGDVLASTAPTVGDVRDAGSDLRRSR